MVDTNFNNAKITPTHYSIFKTERPLRGYILLTIKRRCSAIIVKAFFFFNIRFVFSKSLHVFHLATQILEDLTLGNQHSFFSRVGIQSRLSSIIHQAISFPFTIQQSALCKIDEHFWERLGSFFSNYTFMGHYAF